MTHGRVSRAGNIARYRKFFDIFEIPIHIITDLSALARGFNQLTGTSHIKYTHSKMMDLIGQQVPKPNNPNSAKMKNICCRRTSYQL